MVNTRQNNTEAESPKDMPAKKLEPEVEEDATQLGTMSDKSGLDNDSDLEPLIRKSSQRNWRNVRRRATYATNYRPIRRVREHSVRACRVRLDSEDDLDSDSLFDDEPIFKARRSFRRVSNRRTKQTGDSSMLNENGEKEDEDEAEEPGVRRSKRQKKLLYGSYNSSWIFGTENTPRGYPDMYGTDEEPENVDNTNNSNDARPENVIQDAANDNDTKPLEVDDNEDMYTKVKRTRRTRIRYSPEVGLQSRLRPRSSRPRVRMADGSTESETGGSSDEGGRRRVYHLRQNKPIVERFQINSNEPTRKSSRLVLCSVSRRAFQRKRRDSSSSDEERFQRKKAISLAKARGRCLPLNYNPSEAQTHQKTPIHSSKSVATTSGPKGPADVDPMTIDTSVTFEKVGGLESHLRCLKEMVVLPMLYREVFDQFNIQPPKGILFHGPPGTGKTLIARALANECSQGDRKVSFFMRKGADCLSKWVGESERQLRLLFEQAYQMRPSIIFFDEIDGLAPVRSSKQDQIHASIVSTLLALLDGLDDRGEIIVIGATNRIDAIDPALRRPGRFDRELYFPLPGKKERVDILSIHTKSWKNQPSSLLIADLAERSVGYCGSDLRLLCSEAVVGAMRRRYPQVYRTSKKLLLEPEQVQVQDDDFRQAHLKIVPASCRVTVCPRARLSPLVSPLLNAQFQVIAEKLKDIFPHAGLTSVNDRITRGVYKPRFIVTGPSSQYCQTSYIAPALLDLMEHIPVHVLGIDTLLDVTNRSSEEAVIQIIREASRTPPSVIYLPAIDTWWDLMPLTTQRILLDRVSQLSANAAVLFLATAHSIYNEINDDIKSIFKYDRAEMRSSTQEERFEFFKPLVTEEPLKEPPPAPVPEEEWEELPEAPPPAPPPASSKDMEELHNAEEHRLRELRLFLRDICAKLARNRQFFMFTKPVDVTEVPDYRNIIKRPMDLETMMTNIDLHVYNSAQEFLADIDLIVTNALEYNPERESEDILIRHRACSLRDTAYTLIKAEMDTDFEEECRKISKKRKEIKEKEAKTEAVTANEKQDDETTLMCNGDAELNKIAELARKNRPSTHSAKSTPALAAERIKKRAIKRSAWSRGSLVKKKYKKAKIEEEADKTDPMADEFMDESNPQSLGLVESSQHSSPDSKRPKSESPTTSIEEGLPKKRNRKTSIQKLVINCQPEVVVDKNRLNELHLRLVDISENWTTEALLDCSARIRHVIDLYIETHDRENLPRDLEKAVEIFASSQPPEITADEVSAEI